jgi:uncharacterized protein YpmS
MNPMELLNACETQFFIILALLTVLVIAIIAVVFEIKKSEDLKQELEQLRKTKLRIKCCAKEH